MMEVTVTVMVTEVIPVSRGRGRACGSRSNRGARANQYKPTRNLFGPYLAAYSTSKPFSSFTLQHGSGVNIMFKSIIHIPYAT